MEFVINVYKVPIIFIMTHFFFVHVLIEPNCSPSGQITLYPFQSITSHPSCFTLRLYTAPHDAIMLLGCLLKAQKLFIWFFPTFYIYNVVSYKLENSNVCFPAWLFPRSLLCKRKLFDVFAQLMTSSSSRFGALNSSSSSCYTLRWFPSPRASRLRNF